MRTRAMSSVLSELGPQCLAGGWLLIEYLLAGQKSPDTRRELPAQLILLFTDLEANR